MSENKLLLKESHEKLTQLYEANWTMSYEGCSSCRKLRSPSFAPISGVPVEFCWEVWLNAPMLPNGKIPTAKFKLILIKTVAFNIPSSLNMMIDVKVDNLSETVFEYKGEYPFYIQNLTDLVCIDETLQCLKLDESPESHSCLYRKMTECTLTLKASFISFGHLSSPLLHSRQMRSYRMLEQFMKDFGTIYSHGSLSDMTVIVDDKMLRVHKAILMAHSPVLKRMLEQDFLESNTNTLTIKDYSYEIFDCFLRSLYSGQIEDQRLSTVKELYILADKYYIQILQTQCAEILESQLSVDNVCEILKMAYDCDINDNELKNKAKQFAALPFKDVVSMREWKQMVFSRPQITIDVTDIVYQPQTQVADSNSENIKIRNDCETI